MINGVAAVPIMAMIMLMASRKTVMGQFTLTKWLMVLRWLGTAIMAAAAIGMACSLRGEAEVISSNAAEPPPRLWRLLERLEFHAAAIAANGRSRAWCGS